MNGSLDLAAIRRLTRATPRALGTRAAAGIAVLLGRVRPERRRAIRANLAVLDGDSPELDRLADEALANSGRLLFEMLRGPENDDVPFRIEGAEILDRALARGRGVVLALPHLGNWEIAGCRLAARGTKVTSVAGIQLLPSWAREIRRTRARAGVAIVSPTRAGLRALDAALSRGEIVALHVDGDQFRRGIPVSIAGHTVEFPTGPARLAARRGAPLLFGSCVRRPDGSQVGRVVREIPIDGASPAVVREATRELAALFEAAVLAHPGEWTMFRDFFASRGGERRA